MGTERDFVVKKGLKVADDINVSGDINVSSLYGRLNFKKSAAGSVNNDAIYFINSSDQYAGAVKYFHSGNTLRLQANQDDQLHISDGAIYPPVDSDVDLGTTSLRFKDTFVDSITVTGAVTPASITLGGHSFNDIDIGTELVDTDDHIMSSGAIKAYVDANAGGGIGGSITDNQVAVGASTSDEIEGSSDFTYNASTDTLTVGEKIDSSGTSPLELIAGSSSIHILDGGVANHININPASGRINAVASTLSVGSNSADATVSSRGAYDLTLNTNDGTNSGSITITDGANANITLAPNGTGIVDISTALEVGTGTNPLDNGVVTIINDDVDTYPKTLLLMDNESDATNGPVLTLYRNTTSPADGDILGKIELNGEDSAGNPRAYGSIIQESTDVTNGTHDGTMIFNVADAGGQVDFMTVGKSTVTTTTASSGVRAFTGSVITYSGTGTQALSRDEHGGAYVRATGAKTFTLWDNPKVGDQVVVISDHAGTTTIDGYSNDTINGSANATITTQYNAKTFIATSTTTWIALG